ncbi:hypothetical protein [Gottfriedia luciferensis]|uniref:hypothetical protein n=1 Tax=Gottfriedia luciferensis TaxID=178774 RepID=UPI000B43B02C|nr:hypothetical protein [Gottfriedia luciferensis]
MKGKSHLEKELVDFIINNKDDFYRLAFSYVKNPDDAVDILQESPNTIKTRLYKALEILRIKMK